MSSTEARAAIVTQLREWARNDDTYSGEAFLNGAAAEIEALELEITRQRILLRVGVELDNHHNAAFCPYCLPDLAARISQDVAP